jgi:hypothetical protein
MCLRHCSDNVYCICGWSKHMAMCLPLLLLAACAQAGYFDIQCICLCHSTQLSLMLLLPLHCMQAGYFDIQCICLRHSTQLSLMLLLLAGCVQAGYFDDPLPGAAHFLEHMVHLGSRPFPDEKEYKAFLAAHGGSSNASTSAWLWECVCVCVEGGGGGGVTDGVCGEGVCGEGL